MQYHPAHYATLPTPEEHPHFPVAVPKEEFRLVQISDRGYWINSLSNAGWFITDEGVVLIDSGSNQEAVIEALRRTTNLPVRYVIYTHGHGDHTFNPERYAQIADSQTRVIGHALLPERLSKYEMLSEHISRTGRLQFHRTVAGPARRAYQYPDIIYHGDYEFTLGGRRFVLFHARGETDDGTVVHVPDEGVVFAGDLLISSWPNLGNPFKVPRYGRGWYEALERIQGLHPRVVAPGHGIRLLTEQAAIDQCLDDTIAGLRFVHDEVVRRLNDGQTLAQMHEEIRLPQELEDSPYLEQSYSRVEMAITQIHRGYTGWFDWDPSDLYAVPRDAVAQALRALIDDDAAIVKMARDLWAAGKRAAAVEVLQVLLRDRDEHIDGRRLRLEFMDTLLEEDKCLMSRGVWHHYADLDRAFLAQTESVTAR